MTLSIVARCPDSGQLGVAAATEMMGVGKLLAHAAPNAGAVATQAQVNPYLGIEALALLRRPGIDARQALETVIGRDPKRHLRQLAIVDSTGAAAQWTGDQCLPWAGHLAGPGFAVQGNIIAGRSTLEACAEVLASGAGRHLAERLLLALEAGERVGGDLRGTTSTTIYVIDREEYPLWDIRVDVHEDPMAELRRLVYLFERELLPKVRKMPRRDYDTPRPEADL